MANQVRRDRRRHRRLCSYPVGVAGRAEITLLVHLTSSFGGRFVLCIRPLLCFPKYAWSIGIYDLDGLHDWKLGSPLAGPMCTYDNHC